jgi:hypothetical protein
MTSKNLTELPAKEVLFQLTAPYNAPVMEVWITSLISRYVVGLGEPWRGPLVYDGFEGIPNPVARQETRVLNPNSSLAWTVIDVQHWINSVERHFVAQLNSNVRPDIMAEAISEELKGKRSRGRGDSTRKRNIVAAIPLVPASSALQNQVGVVGSTQYNDYGSVIEQAYSFGRTDLSPVFSAGDQLLHAMQNLFQIDSRLGFLNDAVADGILSRIDPTIRNSEGHNWASPTAEKSNPEKPLHTFVQQALGDATPYHWFHESWNLLMSDPWIKALPPRRWIDWSIAIIRLGIGMGLIWTNRWHEEIARMIVDLNNPIETDQEVLEYLSTQMKSVELLRWPESTESASNRNVKPQFDQSFRRGMNAGLILGHKDLRSDRETLSISAFLRRCRGDGDVMLRLESALSSNLEGNRSVQNLRYTAMDLLASRTKILGPDEAESADHYSLLSHSGRASGEILLFEPTTEIVAVIASLSCRQPSSPATLGDVSTQLERLGLKPSVTELRRHLESAGLSRAVADASLQVEVKSAFEGRER